MSAFDVRAFRVSDLKAYRDRAIEIAAREWLDGRFDVCEIPNAKTFTVDGIPCASGGLVDVGWRTARVWGLLAPMNGRAALAAHKAFLAGMDESPFDRFETYVDANFDLSHRWVRRLGFELDADKPTATVNGMLFVRYVRSRA